jgi:hypothetical protein
MSTRPPLFALDVGTRKVCGLLVEDGPDGAIVKHWSLREHPGRAMLDGQVHVIAQAGRVIAEVKADLEKASGERLEQAHVAVAGRSLAMSRATAKFKTGHGEPLTRDEIAAFELQAVREAQQALSDPRTAAGAYCVGYNVLAARLDGEALSTLEGHRGAEAELEVLATFLPRRALDSLQAALAEAGLSPASLTLEPIAAVQLAVPPELRRLNLAFVDIGAGTSDIALTRDGRVDAFAMVDVAGDELTERLCDAFLLDFKQGEQLKRQLQQPQSAIQDVFGVQRVIPSADACRELVPALGYWAESVADAIKALNNGRAPQAVLLAGGGSLAPDIEAALGAALDVPAGRVGKRPVELQTRFASLPEGLKHAWAVTPLGIAGSALEKRGLPFAHFQVNGRWVQALNLNQRFTAFDALVASGKERVQFYGRPGLATTYSFNDQPRSARGTLGSRCKLFVNGALAPLDAPLQSGDSLSFVDAISGEDGRLTFAEALEREGLGSGAIRLNGDELPLPLSLGCDGQEVEDLSQAVPDRARLTTLSDATVRSLMQRQGMDLEGLIARDIAVSLDGEPRVLSQRNYRLQVNGAEASLDQSLLPGDEVVFEPGAGFQERVRDLLAGRGSALPDSPGEGALRVKLNGDWAPLDTAERVLMNGREVSLDEFLIDGADLRVERASPCRTVGEALQRLGLGTWAEGGRVRVMLNGEAAAMDAAITDGDSLDLALADEARKL